MRSKQYRLPEKARQPPKVPPTGGKRAARQRRRLPRFAERVSVGEALLVSPFCLGMVPSWRLIPAAFEMGINFFFVSTDMHWPLYDASRKGLRALMASRRGIRDEIVVAGACYPSQPEFSAAPFQELVEAVPGMARIDVLVAGGVYGPDLLARAAALRLISKTRRASAIGASFHDRQAALWGANYNVVDLCYIRYNPVHPGARYDLFPKLRTQHPPLFNFKSMHGFMPHDNLRLLNIDQSLWFPDAPDYYRYALSRPQVTGLLFTVARQGQLEELKAALTKGGLSTEEQDHLEQLAILTREMNASTKTL